MQTILAPRASSILFDVLSDRDRTRPFLLPANICPIVPITFLKAGMPFEFVDLSPRTLEMDPDQVDARLREPTAHYGGLLYAHTYGDPFTPSDLFHAIKRRAPDMLVIDDRCLCIPEVAPDFSASVDVTLFSSGYAKIADLGFGGFAFLQDLVDYRHHRLAFDSADLEALEAGYKASLGDRKAYSYLDGNWLQTDSALPAWQEYADRVRAETHESLAHRQALNAVYNSLVPPELCLAEHFQLWRFNLRAPRKAAVLDAIFAAGLFASSHYASLVGIMGPGRGENAHALSEHVINLFNDHHYTLDMAERTAQIVRRSL
jgi:hypothetical protein